MEQKYINGKITLNRACNLRCSWCYAKETQYRNEEFMSLHTVYDVIDIFSNLGLRRVSLIGGEPTLYPYLFEVIERIKQKNMRFGFISNGIAYKNIDFVKKLKCLGMDNFSISLKGTSRKVFLDTTEKDCFYDVISGIENCLSVGATVVVFLVITHSNIDEIIGFVSNMRALGVQKFHFSFLYNYDNTYGYKGYLEKNIPNTLVSRFEKIYPTLDKITNGKIKLFPTFPLCFFNADIVNELINKKQLSMNCQIKDRNTLIFDEDGKVIPCSAMFDVSLGKLYYDFTSADELINYMQHSKPQKLYDRYNIFLTEKCAECEYNKHCTPCACQWTNYSFKQLIATKSR